MSSYIVNNTVVEVLEVPSPGDILHRPHEMHRLNVFTARDMQRNALPIVSISPPDIFGYIFTHSIILRRES